MALKPFEQIVQLHGPVVLRVAQSITNADEAEDVWVEAFMAALRAYPQLSPDANVEAWLVTITRNKAIDHMRASSRRPQPHEEVDSITFDEIELRDDALWMAIETLPTKQRKAVTYHHVGGLPFAEIATMLGNSEVAARRAAADGLKTLRANYKGTGR